VQGCDKSVCRMFVVDEKEGTFCSTSHTSSERHEVPKSSASRRSGSQPGVKKIDSIFDDDSFRAVPGFNPRPPYDSIRDRAE